MNEAQELATHRDRSNGTARRTELNRSGAADGPDLLTQIEASLGIRINPQEVEITPEGRKAAAEELGFSLMNVQRLSWFKIIALASATCIGGLYGYAIAVLLDVRSGLAFFGIMGVIFALASSFTISHVWSLEARAAVRSNRRGKEWIRAVSTTTLFAFIDFCTIGYSVHTLLTQDLFGMPENTATTIASLGVSLMTTAILVLASRSVGSAEGRQDVVDGYIIGRAFNYYPQDVAEAMIVVRNKIAGRDQEMISRHNPNI